MSPFCKVATVFSSGKFFLSLDLQRKLQFFTEFLNTVLIDRQISFLEMNGEIRSEAELALAP